MNKNSKVTSVLIALSVCLILPWAAEPTTPAGNTVLAKKDGKWRCPHMYTCDLIILDEAKGTRYMVKLKDLFPGKEYERHVSLTTAGPIWGQSSFYYVLTRNNTDYFCMHCWTGRRVLVNLQTGKIEDPKPFEKVLDNEEKERIAEVLHESAKLVTKPNKGLEWERLYGAMLLVAKRGMIQTQADLDIIEEHSWQGPIGLFPEWGYGMGLKCSQEYTVLEGRRFAQLALRRLGLKPKGYSQYVFEDEKRKIAIPPDTRKKRTNEIKIGIESQRVYDTLGAPDYIMNAVEVDDTKKPYERLKNKWIDAWRYDFDVPDDFSLVLIWDNEGRVERIEKITPALWRGDELFSDKMPKLVFSAAGNLNGIYLYSPHFLGKISVVEKGAGESNKAIDSDKKYQ
jgi:hypothetical protein